MRILIFWGEEENLIDEILPRKKMFSNRINDLKSINAKLKEVRK